MPKDKGKGSSALGRALKASKGGIMAKTSTSGSVKSSSSSSEGNMVEMGGCNSGGGGVIDRRSLAAEQLRILKQRQLGKKNPGFVVKSKKTALPTIAPSRLGDLAIAPKKKFVTPISSEEASRRLVSSLLEGEEGAPPGVSSPSSSIASSASSKARANNMRSGGSMAGGGSSNSSSNSKSNRFSAFEDHSRTGTPGISLKPASITWGSSKQ